MQLPLLCNQFGGEPLLDEISQEVMVLRQAASASLICGITNLQHEFSYSYNVAELKH
jgi:hypothetical protein